MPLTPHLLWIVAATLCLVVIVGTLRIVRVWRAAAVIPVYTGAREGGSRIRYWPRLFAWDDRSSARVQRVFAIREGISITDVARGAHPALVERGWYLVTPSDLDRPGDAQLIVWQRSGRAARPRTALASPRNDARAAALRQKKFSAEFLDAPRVIG